MTISSRLRITIRRLLWVIFLIACGFVMIVLSSLIIPQAVRESPLVGGLYVLSFMLGMVLGNIAAWIVTGTTVMNRMP